MISSLRNLILLFTVFSTLILARQSLAEDFPADNAPTMEAFSPAQQSLHKESLHKESLHKVAKIQKLNDSDLVFDLQKVDPKILAEDVVELKETFVERQQELEQLVQNKKLDAGDAIIAIVMPGGLLYAGYRKQEFEQAKKNLLAVKAEINDLSNDLTELYKQISSQSLVVAQAP